jgi:hypothetical protein
MYWPLGRRFLTGLIAALVIMGLSVNTLAQTDCADPEATLKLAADEFDKGHFFSVPDLLLSCLSKGGFSRQQQERAYLILVQSYLILEDHQNADTYYLKVLQANPEYETQIGRDPVDLVYLSKKFTATPIFSWYFTAGTSFVLPKVIADNFAVNNASQQYKLGFGWLAGAGVIWHQSDRISADVSVSFLSQSYQLEQSGLFSNDEIILRERMNSVSIPLTFSYMLTNNKKYRPYVGVGITTNLLLGANQNITLQNRTPILDLNNDQIGFTSQELNRTIQVRQRREPLNFQLHLTGGIKYKYKLNYFFAEATYGLGLINVVKRNTLIDSGTSGNSSLQPSFSLSHVDDYFSLNNVQLNVGFVKPLYKPRKLKTAKTKKVSKELSKQS